jgi:hypothetical protein
MQKLQGISWCVAAHELAPCCSPITASLQGPCLGVQLAMTLSDIAVVNLQKLHVLCKTARKHVNADCLKRSAAWQSVLWPTGWHPDAAVHILL